MFLLEELATEFPAVPGYRAALAGSHGDLNDHDTLRHDPVFKLLADCWGVGGLPVEEFQRQAEARSPG